MSDYTNSEAILHSSKIDRSTLPKYKNEWELDDFPPLLNRTVFYIMRKELHVAIDSQFRDRGEFPADQPMEALRTDHRLVEQLFDRYFNARDLDEKKDFGQHILLMLEMHASVEEQVFYPRIRNADPLLVDHCEQDHEQAKQLIEQLQMSLAQNVNDAADIDPLFQQLADSVLKHVQTEEQELFPKIEQSNIDLTAIGQEMQTFETSMIAQRMQKPIAPGIRA